MAVCFFVSDLHGSVTRYESLFHAIRTNPPDAVFLGGDLTPHGSVRLMLKKSSNDFTEKVLVDGFRKIKKDMGSMYPKVFLILGNDDPKSEEDILLKAEEEGLWEYMHQKKSTLEKHSVFGYANIPPTPFRFKDWERYDVSRFVDVGCTQPDEGMYSVEISKDELEWDTIQLQLERFLGEEDLTNSILLFHTPPYQSHLDRAALDEVKVDGVPVDVHVGSIAVQRLIEASKPYITLHGHIHESSSITGKWMQEFNNTVSFSAAWNGPELALVTFDTNCPQKAKRELI
ncbi:MAG: metallophosphoesterase [Bacteroidota bacterium]